MDVLDIEWLSDLQTPWAFGHGPIEICRRFQIRFYQTDCAAPGHLVAEVSQRLEVSTYSRVAWSKQPFIKRIAANERQTELLKEAWHEGGKVSISHPLTNLGIQPSYRTASATRKLRADQMCALAR